MKRTPVLIGLSLLFLLVGANAAEACSCAGRPQGVKRIQTCGYYWHSESVFIGLAEKVEIDGKVGSMKVTFSVEKSIRGTSEKTVEIFTSPSTASCGYPFKQGERYFVYGRKSSDGRLHEGLCGPTTLLRNAEDDIEYASEIEAGKLGTRIFGRVFEDWQPTLKDKRTSKPLSNIPIMIKSKRERYETLTDENGNYLFKDIPKDSYQVFAKLPKGYRELFVRADLTEHFAGSCSGDYFRVTKQGSIRGRVVNFPSRQIQNPWNQDLVQQPKVTLIPLDENNNPIQNYAFEEKWAYRDKFEYFFDVVPGGKYLLAMNPRNCPYPNNGIPPMYYTGVGDRSDAEVITVKEGEQLVVKDFRSLSMLKERWFSGTVKFADRAFAIGAKVSLLDGENRKCGGDNMSKLAIADDQGRFRILGYEGYEYRIRAFTDNFQPKGRRDLYAQPQGVPGSGDVNDIELILPNRTPGR